MTGRRRIYLCGIVPATAAEAVLDRRWDGCPNARNHAPMPEGYLAWHAVAERRAAADQDSVQCPGCGRYVLAVGGRDVRGWPRRQRNVQVVP